MIEFLQVLLTTQNVLILNMSVVDLLLIIFNMPITLLDVINIYWENDSTFGLVKEAFRKKKQ